MTTNTLTVARRWLHVFRGRLRSTARLLLLGLFLHSAFTVFDPVLTKLLIDDGLMQRNFNLFLGLAVATVVLGVAYRLAVRSYQLASKESQNQTTAALVSRLLQSFYRVDPCQLPAGSSGYFVSRLYDESATVSRDVFAVVGEFCVSAATLVAALGVSLYLSWRVTAALLCIVPLLSYLACRFSSRLSHSSQVAMEREARIREHLGRVVEAYRTVKLFALEGLATRTVSAGLRESLAAAQEKARAMTAYETVSQILLALAEACVFMGCGYAVVKGYITLGGLFAFMGSFWKIMSSGQTVISQYPAVVAFGAQVTRVWDFENLPQDATAPEPTDTLVEFGRIGLSYGDKKVFSDFSFCLGPHEKVLVLGPNGAGKSSLVKIATGFMAQDRGVVRRIPRERISALLTPFFFVPGSLKEHTKFGTLDAAERRLFRAMANDFELADKGDLDIASSFSEGEKKKAAIMVTLLKRADLYIFDEPFTNLDIRSKDRVMHWMMHVIGEKSMLMIMHGDEQYHGWFDRIVYVTPEQASRTNLDETLDPETCVPS
jgi:ABC-type multidrug transport system fused ATPase/permease subunit